MVLCHPDFFLEFFIGFKSWTPISIKIRSVWKVCTMHKQKRIYQLLKKESLMLFLDLYALLWIGLIKWTRRFSPIWNQKRNWLGNFWCEKLAEECWQWKMLIVHCVEHITYVRLHYFINIFLRFFTSSSQTTVNQSFSTQSLSLELTSHSILDPNYFPMQ